MTESKQPSFLSKIYRAWDGIKKENISPVCLGLYDYLDVIKHKLWQPGHEIKAVDKSSFKGTYKQFELYIYVSRYSCYNASICLYNKGQLIPLNNEERFLLEQRIISIITSSEKDKRAKRAKVEEENTKRKREVLYN